MLTGAVVLAAALATVSSSRAGTGYNYTNLRNPSRTVVSDADGHWLATFTVGARTVTLSGPPRTFTERTAASPVTTTVYVRLLSAPFGGKVDKSWLSPALSDTSPDLFAVAAQYLEGAPTVLDGSGLQFAGDAGYGPLLADGTRQEGSDFNDYLGIDWTYGSTTDHPEAAQRGDLDCSGYVRMIFGYRGGMPMTLNPDGARLPRRSFQMLDSAPGIVLYASSGSRPAQLDRLAAGDLLFFDAATDDGTRIDHVGIYLGLDAAGKRRFLSSRKSIDGPTMGDYKGASLLDGSGLYATAFRGARRL